MWAALFRLRSWILPQSSGTSLPERVPRRAGEGEAVSRRCAATGGIRYAHPALRWTLRMRVVAFLESLSREVGRSRFDKLTANGVRFTFANRSSGVQHGTTGRRR